MFAHAEKIIKNESFGKQIRVILTQMLFPNEKVLKENEYVVHYVEKNEEPIAYKHETQAHALADYEYLAKIAKQEVTNGRSLC